MMEQEYRHIEELIDRFFDGLTTNEEEQQLYAFFAADDIPEHLREYKETFDYLGGGIIGEIEEEAPVYPFPDVKRPKTVWMRWAAVAATLLLAVGFFTVYMMQKDDFDPLEGSYIVRNGVKITNLDEIRPELEAALQFALQQEAEAERAFRQAEDPDDLYAQIDRDVKDQYCALLSQFTDSLARAEVMKAWDIECN